MMNNDFEEVFRELKKEYLEGLPRKISRIDNLFAKLETSPGDTESLDQLFQLIHKIHGNAGSYNLDRLSLFASEWENRIEPWVEQENPLTSEQLSRLQNFVSSLHEMVHNILKESESSEESNDPNRP